MSYVFKYHFKQRLRRRFNIEFNANVMRELINKLDNDDYKIRKKNQTNKYPGIKCEIVLQDQLMIICFDRKTQSVLTAYAV